MGFVGKSVISIPLIKLGLNVKYWNFFRDYLLICFSAQLASPNNKLVSLFYNMVPEIVQ